MGSYCVDGVLHTCDNGTYYDNYGAYNSSFCLACQSECASPFYESTPCTLTTDRQCSLIISGGQASTSIVGGSVGGALALIFFILCVFVLYRSRRKSRLSMQFEADSSRERVGTMYRNTMGSDGKTIESVPDFYHVGISEEDADALFVHDNKTSGTFLMFSLPNASRNKAGSVVHLLAVYHHGKVEHFVITDDGFGVFHVNGQDCRTWAHSLEGIVNRLQMRADCGMPVRLGKYIPNSEHAPIHFNETDMDDMFGIQTQRVQFDFAGYEEAEQRDKFPSFHAPAQKTVPMFNEDEQAAQEIEKMGLYTKVSKKGSDKSEKEAIVEEIHVPVVEQPSNQSYFQIPADGLLGSKQKSEHAAALVLNDAYQDMGPGKDADRSVAVNTSYQPMVPTKSSTHSETTQAFESDRQIAVNSSYNPMVPTKAAPKYSKAPSFESKSALPSYTKAPSFGEEKAFSQFKSVQKNSGVMEMNELPGYGYSATDNSNNNNSPPRFDPPAFDDRPASVSFESDQSTFLGASPRSTAGVAETEFSSFGFKGSPMARAELTLPAHFTTHAAPVATPSNPYRVDYDDPMMRSFGYDDERPIWLHVGINLHEAEMKLRAAGKRVGQFLVGQQDPSKPAYVFSLVKPGMVEHRKFHKTSDGSFVIELDIDSPHLPTLEDVVVYFEFLAGESGDMPPFEPVVALCPVAGRTPVSPSSRPAIERNEKQLMSALLISHFLYN